MESTANALIKWNRNTLGKTTHRKRRLEARLEGIKKAIVNNNNNGLIKLETKLRKELDEVLHEEELYWYKKSREQWITSGDRNTKYYHLATKVRRARNRCTSLLNNNNKRISEEKELHKMIRDFYVNFFSSDSHLGVEVCLHNAFPVLPAHDWESIYIECKEEEVKRRSLKWPRTNPRGLMVFMLRSTKNLGRWWENI